MRDVTSKNKRINELVEQEISRLELALGKNADLLKIEESNLLEINNALSKSESNASKYRSNIADLKEEIKVLK